MIAPHLVWAAVALVALAVAFVWVKRSAEPKAEAHRKLAELERRLTEMAQFQMRDRDNALKLGEALLANVKALESKLSGLAERTDPELGASALRRR